MKYRIPMKKIASSPLKLILFGEHSVLHGSKCIAFCINKHGSVYVRDVVHRKDEIIVSVTDTLHEGFNLAVGNSPRILQQGVCYDAKIDIAYNLGCGLGTSALISLLSSVSLVHAKGILRLTEFTDDCKSAWDEIYCTADCIESMFHGKSSGVDISTLKTGGVISFQNGEVEEINPEYINKYKILIYNSRISKDTAVVNNMEIKKKNEKYAILGEVAEQAYLLCKKHFKLNEMYSLMRQAQDVLEDIGVVPQLMKHEVRKLREMGIEAKLTGAGNGGHLVTLVEQDVFIENWEEVKIDPSGLILHY